jgi:hypothetical protein
MLRFGAGWPASIPPSLDDLMTPPHWPMTVVVQTNSWCTHHSGFAGQTVSAMSEEKRQARSLETSPLRLRLTLTDFTVIESFRGLYEFGSRLIEGEPGHGAFIRAQSRYARDSDKIPGQEEFGPNIVELLLAKDGTYSKYDRVLDQSFVIYLVTEIFLPLLEAVRRNDIEDADVMLEAEPHEEHENVLRLIFGTIRIRYAPVSVIKKHHPFAILQNTEKMLNGIWNTLYMILVVLIFILIDLLWRK